MSEKRDPRCRRLYENCSEGRQQSQSFHLTIPPPPLPPRFPTSNIPTHSNPQIPHPPSQPCVVASSIPPPPPPPVFYPPQPQDSVLLPNVFQGPLPLINSAPSWSTLHLTSGQVVAELSLNELKVEDLFGRRDNEEWVNNWIRSNKISKNAENPAKKRVKIYAIKEKLNVASRLIKELENGARTLSVMVKSVAPAEWDMKCAEIEVKKNELTMVLNEIKLHETEVNIIKDKFSKRLKKRARLRRQAERRKKQREEDKVRSQNINFQIDNWQKEMQEGVERIQRESELQQEADAVLWGVRQRTGEARRQVALLSALLQLRQVRHQRMSAAGAAVSTSQIQTFNTVIERLRKMWSRHLDECLLEEQALRGMLSEAEVKEDPVKTHKKLVLQEWENALFGSVGSLDSKPRGDDLIKIRWGWDQFISQEHTVLASTIPPGWVLPVPPSSDSWHTLLKY